MATPSKKDMVRAALRKLGADAKPKQIAPFIKKTFGVDIPPDTLSAYKSLVTGRTRPKPFLEPTPTPRTTKAKFIGMLARMGLARIEWHTAESLADQFRRRTGHRLPPSTVVLWWQEWFSEQVRSWGFSGTATLRQPDELLLPPVAPPARETS